jgi:formamidopyrimidine-DNA glycosylase
MPEGPEVRQLVDKLNLKLKGSIIKKINILGGRYKKPVNHNSFNLLQNKKIYKIKCYGKFIYWLFEDSDIVLFNTLGMTGWWEFINNQPHNNIEFELIKASTKFSIFFNDPRNFGTLIVSNNERLRYKLDRLGADIFNINDIEIFKTRLNKKRNDVMIANALLDQSVIAGCGNYLRAECLYIARISPFRELNKLTIDDINKIWNILVQLAWYYYNESKGRRLGIINDKYELSANYKKKGPSLYKPIEGAFHVYRQDNDTLGNKVYSKEINNRTIHYVPSLQI